MHTIVKQFMLSVYADGSLRITERALTKRGRHGQFVSDRPVIVRQAACPVCGAELGLVAL